MNMFPKVVLLVIVASSSVLGLNGDDDYVDSVIDMLLNGGSVNDVDSVEDGDGQEPVFNGGIWKCGMCDELDDSRLVYSEDNDVDTDMMTHDTVDVQIGFTVEDMRCITVMADVTGVVRRVSGSCTGTSVTLNVAPAHHFTVNVYS